MHDALQEFADDNPNASGAGSGPEARARFEDRLTAALQRLAERGGALDPWEEENMLSALGAASLAEYELAAAFVEAADHPPARAASTRSMRRSPLSVATLRRRFERIRAVAR
jgi:hypothetical protein